MVMYGLGVDIDFVFDDVVNFIVNFLSNVFLMILVVGMRFMDVATRLTFVLRIVSLFFFFLFEFCIMDMVLLRVFFVRESSGLRICVE